jgi:hypothetical protein
MRHTDGLASGRGGTIVKAAVDICNHICFLVWLQDWRSASVVPDFAHCLGTNAMNNSLTDIENTTHLSIAPYILKLIAKYAEQSEDLGIASRSGIVGQAANNALYITGR